MAEIARPVRRSLFPAYLSGIAPGAWFAHGRRYLSWTINVPEGTRIHGNAVTWAWITVEEREAWRGEPLWLSAERRATDDSGRDSFTTKGREALTAEIVPVVASYGFSKLWYDRYAARLADDSGRGAADCAEAARAQAVWWDQLAELHRMIGEGLVEFVPLPRTPIGQRDRTVRCVESVHNRDYRWAHVTVELRVNSEPVGWMTDDGRAIPPGDVLEAL